MIRGVAQVLLGLLIGSLSVLGLLALLEKLDPSPRAYCLEANGDKGTVYVIDSNSAIMILDAPSAGRYVVSEGRCEP